VSAPVYALNLFNIADLHPHREKGASDYVWHLFDKLEDLRPILK
jgi:hypothetical protein